MTQKSRSKIDGEPNPIDVHVGSRVQMRRTLLGLSRKKLGDALGLTFHQIRKYEFGINRIGASRLHDLSQVLKVPITFFFDDLDTAQTKSLLGVSDSGQAEFEHEDLMSKKETFDLIRAYYKIKDPKMRKQILEMAKVMSATSQTKQRQSRK